MSYNDIRTTEPPFPTPVSQDDYDALAARLAASSLSAPVSPWETDRYG